MPHKKSQSHIQVRGPKGKFVKDTPANRKKKNNTVERVPNPGYGDT